MSLLVQVSDPHFGTERPQVVEALLRWIHAAAPEIVVMSGDITQRARRAQFRAARRFVERMAVPVTLALPGNHDIPLFNLVARLFHPYRNYHRAFGPDLEPVFESADFLVLAVNTTRPCRHKHGEVSDRQIVRVAERLRCARPEQLRVVVTHQPVHVPRPDEEKNLLQGSARAVREWANAGADLILGGHIHLPYVRPLRERLPDLTRDVWVVQAGTAVSRRIRYEATNSIQCVHYDRADSLRRCAVEQWDYAAESDEFELIERREVALDRDD